MTYNKENIYTFLANAQGITTRAVRQMEKDNPARFEREAMGALLQASKVSFSELYNYIQQDSGLFNFEESIKKSRTLDQLSSLLVKDVAKRETREYGKKNTLVGFLSTYFKDYTNDKKGRLSFVEFDKYDDYGYFVGTVLEISEHDITSSYDRPKSTNLVFITYAHNISNTRKSIDDIIKEVKQLFPDYRKEAVNQKSFNIDVELTIDKNAPRVGFVKSNAHPDIFFPTKVKMSYLDKVLIVPNFVLEDGLNIAYAHYMINGMEYNSNEGRVADEVWVGEFIDYANKVADSLGLSNDENIIENNKMIKEVVNEIKNTDYSKDEDSDAESMDWAEVRVFASNIINIILDSIEPGLSDAFSKLEDDKELKEYHPAIYTISKQSLAKWTQVEGASRGEVYTRTIKVNKI